jgi:hypothetical protein
MQTDSLSSNYPLDAPAPAVEAPPPMTPQPLTQSSGGQKKSYSPFGRKPVAARSNSLYSAPLNVNPAEPLSGPVATPVTPSNFPGQRTNPLLKKSFSPFGRKPVAAINNDLDSPSNAVTSEDSYVNPVTTAPDAVIQSMDTPNKPLNAGVQTTTMTPKKSYSPFGAKPVAPKNDSLYDAPRFAEWDDETFSNADNGYSSVPPMPFAATSLEEVAMAEDVPIPPTVESYREQPSASSPQFSNGIGGMKKSYSPFGSKPQASSGTGGGYLEGL